MKLSPKGKVIVEILILLLSVVLTYFFWDSFFIYPIKLFVVLLHEFSHCLIGLVSGGSVSEIKMSYQIGGVCIIKGGNQFLISLSGYFGSLLFGGLLFVSAKYYKFSKYFCSSFAFIFIVLIFSLIKDLFGILFTLGFAIILYSSPRILPKIVHSYLLKILGIISCLYTIIDIKDDLITYELRKTDAQILASLTGVPSIIWGIIIMTVSLIVVYFLFKIKFQKITINY